MICTSLIEHNCTFEVFKEVSKTFKSSLILIKSLGKKFIELVKQMGLKETDETWSFLLDSATSIYPSPIGLHTTMFIPTLKG